MVENARFKTKQNCSFYKPVHPKTYQSWCLYLEIHVPIVKTSMLGLFEAIAFFGCNPPDITVGQVLFGLSHSTSELNGGDASSGIRLFLCDSSMQLV